jgi:hypothetical protein
MVVLPIDSCNCVWRPPINAEHKSQHRQIYRKWPAVIEMKNGPDLVGGGTGEVEIGTRLSDRQESAKITPICSIRSDVGQDRLERRVAHSARRLGMIVPATDVMFIIGGVLLLG